MGEIKAADVATLRKQTGAGMMDCKKALVEASGDFEAAIEVLRKKGQKVAANRADRNASEGIATTKINSDKTSGVAIVEADSIEAAMRWTMKWNDLMDITLDPAVEDEVVGQMCVEKLTALGEM